MLQFDFRNQSNSRAWCSIFVIDCHKMLPQNVLSIVLYVMHMGIEYCTAIDMLISMLTHIHRFVEFQQFRTVFIKCGGSAKK